MKYLRSLRDRLRVARAEENGFTMVELVIAIPVTILLLGTVMVSIGVAVGLQSQVTTKIAASREANNFIDQMNTARNCPELNYIIRTRLENTTSKYIVSLGSYSLTSSCVNGKPVTVPFTLRTASDNHVYYNRTITLAAM